MPQAGIGAGNALFLALETTYGTLIDPSGVGIWVPILEEDLVYREEPYFSEQIRGETIVSDRKPGYYHVEGNVRMEVDCNYMPYFLYASRHTVTKTGVGPFLYSAVPSSIGSAYPGGAQRSLSLSMIRNGVGFGYAGCVVGGYEFTVDNGVLIVNMNILGLSEADLGALGTPSFLAPSLLGADAHSVYVDASGLTPAFAARDNTFNGFTFRANYNASAQNRIRPDRSASYVAFGLTETGYDTELDFLDKTEYNNFKNGNARALRFESLKPGGLAGTFAAATEAFRISAYRSMYDEYTVATPAIGDIVMARVTGRALAISGGAPYRFECKSATSIV